MTPEGVFDYIVFCSSVALVSSGMKLCMNQNTEDSLFHGFQIFFLGPVDLDGCFKVKSLVALLYH